MLFIIFVIFTLLVVSDAYVIRLVNKYVCVRVCQQVSCEKLKSSADLIAGMSAVAGTLFILRPTYVKAAQ